ncbi:flagellar export chaperone FlgN [Oceanitalea stevensii]|uniref:Flagellar protein FlgN n=1 Tax=Oceanitalea stevensii TaxID=2763072 RepID=A0ABR8Z316_9MICO|nr:flagellar export chaperone FlgN [Oceanitalea stevensii]MBD8062723.1 flagellar protein FlgN [Oceanitalea stevensii]
MRALSDFLWHERDVLELLLHRLETERALLETGRTRRLPRAAREIDAAIAQLRTAELGRAAEAAAATQVLGLPATASLLTIAGTAPVPWGDIFLDHRAAMRELVDQIVALADGEQRATPAVGGTTMDAMADADAELTDAVVELELERLGRGAAENRGGVMQRELLAFLA